MALLIFRACNRNFLVHCENDEAVPLVRAAFGDLLVSSSAGAAGAIDLCRVLQGPSACRFRVQNLRGGTASFSDASDLIFHLDKLLTIELQYQRPDLYFIHAAAVALNGRVALLAAPPGTGKSTLTLALLNNGFSYLSDELAPIDVRTTTVHPYAHALCLKAVPPQPYVLPPRTLAGERFHVPVAALSAPIVTEALSLAAIIFIQRSQGAPAGSRPITPARAAARLMANALNPMAHHGHGLDVAVTIAQAIASFELDSSDLQRACNSVETILSSDVLTAAN